MVRKFRCVTYDKVSPDVVEQEIDSADISWVRPHTPPPASGWKLGPVVTVGLKDGSTIYVLGTVELFT